MNKSEAKSRIEKLRALIDQYRFDYHVLDKSNVSEAVNDALKHELLKLEEQYPEFITPDSPTQRVGGEPLAKFKKVTHGSRMTSLEDIFSFEELAEWEKRNQKLVPKDHFDYYVELKIDGFAISLNYEDGILITAATRGNGLIGEDVTSNVKTIEAIPLRLHKNVAGRVEVRGEIFMSKKEFERINKDQEKKGEPLFTNPRNLAAGSIRQLDPKLSASRKLDFFAYELVSDMGQKDKMEEVKIIQSLGFKTIKDNHYAATINEVQEFFNDWKEKRNHQGFLIDGLVIKINNKKLRDSLGIIGKAPRGMIAYKFPAEQATTIIKHVEFNVGRTGVLTPLATFEPVLVAGTTVQHATLHNLDEIERLGVKIGDTVVIEKAGDIIPKVIKVLTELRTGKEKNITIPNVCPVCGSPVARKEGEVAIYCSNQNCFAAEIERIKHAVSRQGFNIDGLGAKIVEQFITVGLVKTAADIFRLTKEDIEELERFAEKSAANIIASIQDAKKISLARFIYALGIRHVGEETSIALAQHFGDINKLKKASLEELLEIGDVGEVVAKSIYEFFHVKHSLSAVDDLLNYVQILKPQKTGTVLNNMKFVVTGSLENFTRDSIKERIRDLGGSVSGAVSKETDYLLAGEDAGSKFDKAKSLGVKILTEQEFLDMIKEEGAT